MKKIDIKQYILPIYLTIVILLQSKLSTLNVLLTVFPISVIILSIYQKNKKIGIAGMFLFYILSMSIIIVNSIEEYFIVFLKIILLIIPSIILLNQILQIENKQIFILSNKGKPIVAAILLFTTIFGFFYFISSGYMEGFLLSTDSISGQIILLGGLTIVCCGPLLIWSKKQ